MSKATTRDDGYLEFRDRMRSVDPDIAVGAVGLPEGESWSAWGTKVIAGTGDLLDFYVIHHYGFGGEPDGGAALAVPQQAWPELMQSATATLVAENPTRTVPIAITEYNMVVFQDADINRLMAWAINLLYIADTIGQMAENGVTIVTQWNLANGKAPNGTDYGLIDADTGARNPQYYVLALWTRFGDELLATDVGFETDTELSAYAGRAGDGTISILAINKTGEPTTARIRIGSGAAPCIRHVPMSWPPSHSRRQRWRSTGRRILPSISPNRPRPTSARSVRSSTSRSSRTP